MKLTNTPTIERHPPERRRRSDIFISCGCSCCCCCCLHTVGGIIGAAVAATTKRRGLCRSCGGELNNGQCDCWEIESRNPRVKPRIAAEKMYWSMSLGAAIVFMMGTLLIGSEGFIVAQVLLAVVFPAVQLVCAILTRIVLAFSNRPDRAFQISQVGRITLGLFLGTLAGIAVMVGIGVIISYS